MKNKVNINNDILFYIVLTILFFLCNRFLVYLYIPIVLIVLIKVFKSANNQLFYLILFLIPNLRILDVSGSLHIINILIAIAAIVYISKKIRHFPQSIVIASVVFLICSFSHIFYYDNIGGYIFTEINIVIDYVVFLLLVSDDDSGIEYFTSILYLSAGAIVSAVVCLLAQPDILLQVLNVSWYRFNAYGTDPNYYAVYLLMAIVGLFREMYLSNKILKYLPIVMILMLFGFLTTSKMFIFTLAIIILVNIFLHFMKRQMKSWSFLLKISTVIIAIFFIFKDVFLTLFKRFIDRFIDDPQNNTLKGFTSGRSNIQMSYINYISENIMLLLFGVGTEYGSYYDKLYGIFVAHNTYLDLILSFGVIGTIIIVLLTIKAIYPYIKKKNNIANKFPILIFGLVLVSLSCLTSDMFYYIFALVILPLKAKDTYLIDTEKIDN